MERARKAVDWAAIEVDYRAGTKTLRQIGAGHGISHVAVLKHAKAKGWTRNPPSNRPERVALVTSKVTNTVSDAVSVESTPRTAEVTGELSQSPNRPPYRHPNWRVL